MKYIKIILFVCCIIHIQLNAQENKRGNIWAIGLATCTLDFNGVGVPTFDTLNFWWASTQAVSNICDTNGKLLFYCNGFTIADKDGALLNGDSMNSVDGYKLFAYYNHSPFYQTNIILPKRGNQYYVFSVGCSDSAFTNFLNGTYGEFDVLSYCMVDMDSNNGKGKVVVKDKIVAENRHYRNAEITAVQHANGRDWWLIKTDARNHQFETYLVEPDTILGPYYQPISDTGDFTTGGVSYIVPNKEGTKLAFGGYGMLYIDTVAADTTYDFNRVDIYDFDRCSGTVMYKNHYIVPYDTTSYPNNDYKGGGGFSPDGNLFYASNLYTIYQIDLNDTNKYNSVFITGPDTVINYFPWYSGMTLAPNNKLYIGNEGGGLKSLCFIDSPNIKGLGCAFRGRGNGAISQPFTTIQNPPNMPFFGLGAVVGSGCDTVTAIDNLPSAGKWKIYPNPASTVLNIDFVEGSNKYGSIIIVDAVGREIVSIQQPKQQNKIETSGWSKGIYFVRVGLLNRGIGNKVLKFVKE